LTGTPAPGTHAPHARADAAPLTRDAIESLLEEDRRFPPPEGFRRHAHVQDARVYDEARDLEAFWERHARDYAWSRPWTQVLDWDLPFARWFVGGRTNLAANCLDRHVVGGRGGRVAFHWEGEPGDRRTVTYADLHAETCRAANALRALGVRRGDRVAIYMGMVPEAAVAMLACARIGAAHTVVFGGFSPNALRERIHDCGATALVTCDGAWRRGSVVPLKRNADEALEGVPTVRSVLVVRRIGDAAPVAMRRGRDHWWHEAVAAASPVHEPEPMDAEDLLFVLYTSGTTGKPKGIAHTTGGYMVAAGLTTRWVFDLKNDDVYWCTADVGWVTGHTYVVYGPLLNGATSVLYEGAPDFPARDRFWEVIARYRATILYTAPTAIRTFMRWGTEHLQRHDLSSLRLLGTVGEPINPEAWMWYHEHVGGGRCPIVDTWWQTETGSILITPLPGLTTTKPGSACRPFPGVVASVVDEAGKAVPPGTGGFLVIERPWPSMLRGIYGDPERYVQTYWSRFPGRYFPGDGARIDEEGYAWLLGRVDDVMLVAGHNISTAEVEHAAVDHPAVAECAVVGRTHELKGQAIAAFVTVKQGIAPTPALAAEIRGHVAHVLGALARPEEVHFAADLPKTRSGKIMRRLLRDVAEGRALGDTTTLADPAVVDLLRREYEHRES
jgi:acetyl-CoA synthetase